MAIEHLEFSVNEEWKKFQEKNPWVSFIPEFAKDVDGQEYMKKKGGSVAYKIIKEDVKGNQIYECAECGSKIMGATIARPIWDGPFPGSGSGRCHYEKVPYCPKCEVEPNSSGIPIEVGPKVCLS